MRELHDVTGMRCPEIDKGGREVYECFHCGERQVIWDSDFDFEDFGYEGEGIVQILHCMNCGAEIEYRVPCHENDT